MNPYTPPDARVADAIQPPDPATRKGGLITQIGTIYLMMGLVLAVLALLRVKIGGYQLAPWNAVTPALLALAGLGAILRQKWGTWSCYFFSVILLLGVPIGTIFGGLMIYHLTIYRAQFDSETASRARVKAS